MEDVEERRYYEDNRRWALSLYEGYAFVERCSKMLQLLGTNFFTGEVLDQDDMLSQWCMDHTIE